MAADRSGRCAGDDKVVPNVPERIGGERPTHYFERPFHTVPPCSCAELTPRSFGERA